MAKTELHLKSQEFAGLSSEEHAEILRNMRIALIKSMGYTDEQLGRPFVAVIHSWNEVSPGHFHLKPIAEEVKMSIREAGGTPAEIIIPGICGSMSGGGTGAFRYNVAYRDFAAALVEIMINLNQCDAAVLIATCDHVIPAFAMGAALTNVPSIIVTGGYMEPGEYKGQPLTSTSTIKSYGRYKRGLITKDDLQEIVNRACPGPGACPDMATANTMASVIEALGLCLPGNTAVAAMSADLVRIAKEAGRQVMELFKAGIRPRDIITREACENAMRLVLAVGGSPNALVHLAAIAKQVDIDIDWERWDELSRETPFICSVLPNNPNLTMKDLDRAGRVIAVMKELEPLLNLDTLTVTGKTLRENLTGVSVYDRSVIRPLDDPYSSDGGLVILKGNLAPEGAIMKKSACPPSMLKHRGPAKVFDSEDDAMVGLMEGKIKPGDVVVVRYEGPKGSPGGRKVTTPMHSIVGLGLTDSVALVTDGAFSGTNLGAGIGYVSPEAASGGPIAIVRDGDEIEIDVEGRRIDLLIPEEELNKRLAEWQAPPPKETKGVLGLFARSASSYPTGAYVF